MLAGFTETEGILHFELPGWGMEAPFPERLHDHPSSGSP